MAVSNTFRDTFTFAVKDVRKWFPGHMGFGMKKMQQKLRIVDCILEVRDARVPFSSKNIRFEKQLTIVRPKILLINKTDLITLKDRAILEERLTAEESCPVFFTNAKNGLDAGLKKILPTALELINSIPRLDSDKSSGRNLMVIGIPNVGKSSIINQLRGIHAHRGKATKVGALPGVTVHVLEKIKIYENPLVYLLDTPGILSPEVGDIEAGLKLALCAILKDHLVGEDVIADYLLYWLNRQKDFRYVDCLGLKGKSDNILEVMLQVAAKHRMGSLVQDVNGHVKVKPNLHAAATFILKQYRLGAFGKIFLDKDRL